MKEYPLDRGDDRKLKDEGKQWMREREERKRGGHGNTQGQGASENSPTATARPSEDGRPDLGKHAAVGGMGIDEQSGGRLDGEDTKNTQGSRSASSTPGSEFERRLTETDIEKANS